MARLHVSSPHLAQHMGNRLREAGAKIAVDTRMTFFDRPCSALPWCSPMLARSNLDSTNCLASTGIIGHHWSTEVLGVQTWPGAYVLKTRRLLAWPGENIGNNAAMMLISNIISKSMHLDLHWTGTLLDGRHAPNQTQKGAMPINIFQELQVFWILCFSLRKRVLSPLLDF